MLTANDAKNIWRYEPETGYLFWLISPRYDIVAGDRAGYHDGKYWRVAFKGKQYKASRVAWLMVTGNWPTDQIDHINGDRLDDRFVNLREATNAENSRNRSTRRDNALGIKGVCRIKGKSGFITQVFADGKLVYWKRFGSLDKAKSAYKAESVKFHGKFARNENASI